MFNKIWKYLIQILTRNVQKILSSPSIPVPSMSADEMARVAHFIRTKFPEGQWLEKTKILTQYMFDLESQMLHHWVNNGPNTPLQFICWRDSYVDDREGYTMGEFLRNFYAARGFNIYSKAEVLPDVGYVWVLNLTTRPST